MAGVEVRDFDSPDETRTPDKTTIEIVRMGGATASRMRLEPGWRWSECIKPIVGGESCQARHLGLLQSGTMHVVHDDGTRAGDRSRPGLRHRARSRRVGRRRRAHRGVRVPVPDCRGVRERLTAGMRPKLALTSGLKL